MSFILNRSLIMVSNHLINIMNIGPYRIILIFNNYNFLLIYYVPIWKKEQIYSVYGNLQLNPARARCYVFIFLHNIALILEANETGFLISNFIYRYIYIFIFFCRTLYRLSKPLGTQHCDRVAIAVDFIGSRSFLGTRFVL